MTNKDFSKMSTGPQNSGVFRTRATLPNLNSIIGNTSALESGLEGFNRQLFTGVSFSIAIVASNGLGLAIGGDRLTVSDNAYLAIYILSTLAALEHPLEALEAR